VYGASIVLLSVTLHGGPVVLRSVRATPCFYQTSMPILKQEALSKKQERNNIIPLPISNPLLSLLFTYLLAVTVYKFVESSTTGSTVSNLQHRLVTYRPKDKDR